MSNNLAKTFNGDFASTPPPQLHAKLLAFTIGAGSVVVIPIGAAVYAGEILAVLCCMILAQTCQDIVRRKPFIFLIPLWFIWIGAQFVSDYVNGTEFIKQVRLDVAIILFLPAMVGLSALFVKYPSALRAFCLGLALSCVIGMFLNPELSLQTKWKWTYAVTAALCVSLLVFLLQLGRRERPITGSFILIGAGVIGFFTDARSLSGLLLLIGLWMFTSWFRRSVSGKGASAPMLILASYCLVALAPIVIYLGYTNAARGGLLGEFAKQRYELQSTGNASPLIVSRLELFASAEAIKDRPISGHGAWAEDIKYLSLLALMERNIGYFDPATRIVDIGEKGGSLYIPMHSMILGVWVWGGVFATFMMWYMLSFSIRTVRFAIFGPGRYFVILAFCGLEMLWTILFSPFASVNRINIEIMSSIAFAVFYFGDERLRSVVR